MAIRVCPKKKKTQQKIDGETLVVDKQHLYHTDMTTPDLKHHIPSGHALPLGALLAFAWVKTLGTML